jgi:PTS system mannose-specific IIC component
MEANKINTAPTHDNTNKKKIIGITACAAGIAHTYMAADALKLTGTELGYDVHIETQGATGAENKLSPQQIHDADVVIIAADVRIDTSRFDGKRVLSTGVNAAIKDPKGLIEKAFANAQEQSNNNKGSAPANSNTKVFAPVKPKGVLSHMMTGIS